MTAIATKNAGRKKMKDKRKRKIVSAHSLRNKNVKHDGAASIVSSYLIRLII
jgi:hypothetical protein